MCAKSRASGVSRVSGASARSVSAPTAQQTGGASGGAGGGGSGSAQQQGGKPQINATNMTKSEFMAKYNGNNPNRAQKSASYDYTDPRVTSTGYAKSQNMNWKLDTGQRLTSKEQAMLDGMEQMQRPLGKDTVLHRGAHQNILQALGVSNYDKMSQTQLRQSLVGRQWTSKSLTSTSYDYNSSPFLGTGPVAGGREVVMRIHAAGSVKATCVNPSQAEVVLGRGTNWQITDAKFTGGTANPKVNGRRKTMPVVMLDIDVW